MFAFRLLLFSSFVFVLFLKLKCKIKHNKSHFRLLEAQAACTVAKIGEVFFFFSVFSVVVSKVLLSVWFIANSTLTCTHILALITCFVTKMDRLLVSFSAPSSLCQARPVLVARPPLPALSRALSHCCWVF